MTAPRSRHRAGAAVGIVPAGRRPPGHRAGRIGDRCRPPSRPQGRRCRAHARPEPAAAVHPGPAGGDPRSGAVRDRAVGGVPVAQLPGAAHRTRAGGVAQQDLEQQRDELQARKAALYDPDYIAAEARRRLQYVTPGDTVFVVHAPAWPAPRTPPRRAPARISPGTATCGPRSPRGTRNKRAGAATTCRPWETVSDTDRELLTRELGRPPRGLLAVAYRCDHGVPAVVQTAPRLPGRHALPDHVLPVLLRAELRRQPDGIGRASCAR